MDQVLRLKKSYRNLGVMCLIFFSGMMVVSFFGILSESNLLDALRAVGFCGCLLVLPAMMLLAYYRQSISIQEETIIQTGIFRQRKIAFTEMAGVRWRLFPAGGSVVLRSSTEKIKIHFDNFEAQQKHPLILSLRRSLPQSIQQNWEPFCLRLALPLLKHGPDAPLQKNEVLITRRYWDRFFLIVTLVLIVCGIVCAWSFQKPLFLTFPLISLVFWPMMRFSTPPEGMRTQKLPPQMKWGLLFLSLWIAIAMATIVPLSKTHMGLAIGLTVVWFAILLLYGHWMDRRRKATQDQDPTPPPTVDEWERLTAK